MIRSGLARGVLCLAFAGVGASCDLEAAEPIIDSAAEHVAPLVEPVPPEPEQPRMIFPEIINSPIESEPEAMTPKPAPKPKARKPKPKLELPDDLPEGCNPQSEEDIVDLGDGVVAYLCWQITF